jgi:prevent-host-death family protein
MAIVPVARARAQLSRLVEEASSTHERFEITRNGQRVAVLLGADEYDALHEIIAVLADADLQRDHLAGIETLKESDTLDIDQLTSVMGAAGRLPVAE